MNKVMGATFRRPHTRAIVRVCGVKREKGKAYVKFEPDMPDAHLCFGTMELSRFKKLMEKQK